MRKKWLAIPCIISMMVFAVSLARGQSTEGGDIKQVKCTGKVVDEQGRPLAGVMISLHEMVYDAKTYSYDSKVLGKAQTMADGAFSFNETVKDNQYRYGYIIARKEGLALGFDNWSMRDGDKDLEIKLGQPKELAGVVVDEKDAPVADARVSVSMLVLGEGRERKNLGGFVATELLTKNTDGAGKFVFTGIPAGATAEFIVKKAGMATVGTYKRTGAAYQKLSFAEGQTDIKLVLPVEAKIEGKIVEKKSGKPVGGVSIRCTSGLEIAYFRPKPIVSKDDGTFCFDALIATNYVVEHIQPTEKLPDWVADSVEVITETGATKSGVTIELNRGGVLEVKVIDAVNKEPVEEASVSVNSQVSGRYANSRSDKDGIVQMRLMPGDYRITYIQKQGYSRQRLQDSVTVEEGKTQRLEYELLGMPKITGVVFDENDKPIEGVELEICPAGGREDSVSDAEGKFEVIYDLGSWSSDRTPTMMLVGRHEQRNLATAIQVDEDTREISIKLEPAVTMTGQIVDINGKGIADVEVRTMLQGPRWGSTIGRKPAVTDGDGKYLIKALPPDHTYSVYARAEGYGESRGEEISTDAAVDNRLDMGRITLAVANLSVSGVVVDDDNRPVAGASISCYGDNQPYRNTRTDTEGKFTLEKVCAGNIRISANKSGTPRLYGSIETEGGAADVRIVISQRSSSTRYQPKRPPSLVGRPLPELKDLKIELSPADIKDKMILLCFWDMQQRPSRNCVMQIARQEQQLRQKGVTVVAVQASTIDENTLNQWVKKYKIPFAVGMIAGNEEKTRFAWGVRSLPWLILTDRRHVVRSGGFGISALNEKIKAIVDTEQ